MARSGMDRKNETTRPMTLGQAIEIFKICCQKIAPSSIFMLLFLLEEEEPDEAVTGSQQRSAC